MMVALLKAMLEWMAEKPMRVEARPKIRAIITAHLTPCRKKKIKACTELKFFLFWI